MSEWKPIDENTPKDRPIVAWCDHKADPYHVEGGSLTTYAAHVESFGKAEDGLQILVWGGEWDDADDGYIPAWWFVQHSDFEKAANPTHWLDVKSLPHNTNSK
jgi:hypothetical protein